MKVLNSLVLALLLIGCIPKEKLVRVSEQTLPKSVTIAVKGVIEGTIVTIEEDRFRIRTATIPVTFRGAGVFISENNHVLTCDHLFGMLEITSITVCDYTRGCAESELLFKEQKLDLALLKANFSTKSDYARIADPRKVEVGQQTIAIGNPRGLPFSVSHGIVSALHRDQAGVYNMTQSDTFINPGNSGGPLFNMKGELIGINSRIMCASELVCTFSGLGFSTSSGQIIEFLSRFRGLDKSIPAYKYSYWQRWKDSLDTLRGK